MYQKEAMWISFRAWKPVAVKIAIGNINVVSGEPWGPGLSTVTQDYVVCPSQPWLDGINSGDGFVRQFVAMPLGKDYTVESQITGKEDIGGIQIEVFPMKKTDVSYSLSNILNDSNNDLPLFSTPKMLDMKNGDLFYVNHHSFPTRETRLSDVGIKEGDSVELMVGTFPIIAKMLSEKRIPIVVQLDTTIEQVKILIQEKEGILAPHMRIVFGGRHLDEQKTIQSCGIEADNIVHVVTALRGGVAMPTETEMGLAIGGKIKQKIYEDKHGVHMWNQKASLRTFVHIANSEAYKKITGKLPPESPIDVNSYRKQGIPWFDLCDEKLPSVSHSIVLEEIKPIEQKEKEQKTEVLMLDPIEK